MSAIIAFFLSPIGRLIGVGLLAAFIAGAGATWATATIYGAKISDLKAEQANREKEAAQAALDAFIKNSKIIAAAAADYLNGKNPLAAKMDELARDLANAQHATPLPANCKPDSARVRSFNAAISAANDSISGHSPGATVPPAH